MADAQSTQTRPKYQYCIFRGSPQDKSLTCCQSLIKVVPDV